MTIGSPQPAIPNVPVGGSTPQPYTTAQNAMQILEDRWGLTATLYDGHLLVASMRLDEEAPFMGVKLSATQERQWPRTFKYGWPNIVAAPNAVLVSTEYGGAFYLNYEGVVPQQIVEWVSLEAYKMVTLDWDKGVLKESVTGASIEYSKPIGTPGAIIPQLEIVQASLLAPFLMRQGHEDPFINFAGF